MTGTSDPINYRVAVQDDEPEILVLFKEVAPEIPIPLEEPGTEDRMITEIVQCRGGSWVAVDANGNVVGFALARPDLRANDRATSLKYIGVSGSSRGLGISSKLVKNLKAKGVPLTVLMFAFKGWRAVFYSAAADCADRWCAQQETGPEDAG